MRSESLTRFSSLSIATRAICTSMIETAGKQTAKPTWNDVSADITLRVITPNTIYHATSKNRLQAHRRL